MSKINLTCNRMNVLTQSYFKWKLQCGCVRIVLFKDGLIDRRIHKNYEIRFTTLIADIYLEIQTTVKLKCTKRIRCLAFDFFHCQFSLKRKMKELNIIAEQLKNLNVLYMWHPPFIGSFLKRCKNLHTLCIIKKFIKQNEFELTNNVYPNLKVFILFDLNSNSKRSNSMDLTQFLSNKVHLHGIGLYGLSAIQNFLHLNSNVSYAVLWFPNGTDLLNVMKDTETMCKQNRINSLHLGIQNDINQNCLVGIFQRIQHLSNVKSFHFNKKSSSHEELFENVPIQWHLQTLCIGKLHNKIQNSNQITKPFSKFTRVTRINFFG